MLYYVMPDYGMLHFFYVAFYWLFLYGFLTLCFSIVRVSFGFRSLLRSCVPFVSFFGSFFINFFLPSFLSFIISVLWSFFLSVVICFVLSVCRSFFLSFSLSLCLSFFLCLSRSLFWA